MTIAPVKLLGVKEEDAVKEAEKLLARVGLLDKKGRLPGTAFRRPEAEDRHCPGADDEAGCDAV
mgnify:CR=1 FL=1